MGADPVLGFAGVGGLQQHVYSAHERPRGVVQRRRERHDRNACAVRSLSNLLAAPNWSFLLQSDGHRALIMRQRRAVWLVQAPRDTPLVLAHHGAAARERYSGFVVEGNVTFRVRHVDRGGDSFDQVTDVPLALATSSPVLLNQPLQVRTEAGQLVGLRQRPAAQRAWKGVPKRHGRDRLLGLTPNEEGS